MEEKKKKILLPIYEWAESLTFAMLIIVLIYACIFRVYTSKGSSMLPTVYDGERVFVWSAFYKPEQGDVVILDESITLGDSIIKRVAATSGQTIDIDRGTGEVTVDGKPFDTPVAASADNLSGDTVFPYTVPNDCVFVLGDNRRVSLDSRYSVIGAVSLKNVIGRAAFRFPSFGAL